MCLRFFLAPALLDHECFIYAVTHNTMFGRATSRATAHLYVVHCFIQNGRSALMNACEKGHITVVETLLNHKANVYLLDNVSNYVYCLCIFCVLLVTVCYMDITSYMVTTSSYINKNFETIIQMSLQNARVLPLLCRS